MKLLATQRYEESSTEQTFTKIYQDNIWRDSESRSGRGSSLEATVNLREDFSRFCAYKNVKTIVDLPCGDYNWFRAVSTDFIQYDGYDIVQPLIESNNEQYGSETVNFHHHNILEDRVKSADFALSRDFVIHMNYKSILEFFENIKQSNIPDILLTHYTNCENKDIESGNRYRPIDFTLPPFSFPQPQHLIEEDISSMFDTAQRHAKDPDKPLRKYLAHWKTQDIQDALDQSRQIRPPAFQLCK